MSHSQPTVPTRLQGSYSCQRCTACCRWPGQVRVGEAEIAVMSAHLGICEWDFIQQFTRLRADRAGLVLTEQPGGACVFLEGQDCRVQPVKPRQCSAFPHGWSFPGWREVCQAIFRVGENA